MTVNPFSPMWYRVADLRPQLRRECEFHTHVYRGVPWHVLHDHASGRVHRFTAPAHFLIRLMNGKYSVDELWQRAEDEYGDAAPTQQEMLELLAQLHGADLLRSNVPPDVDELFRRHRGASSRKWRRRFASPFAVRIRLFDPNGFLDRTIRYVAPLLSPAGLVAWFAVVSAAAVLVAANWTELGAVALDELVTPGNLVLVWLCYPLIKLAHEFGHAYAAKRWGAEVHDMGVMFLVFIPLPYVDASATAAWPERRRRMLVAAMGIMVELLVAAIALFVWLLVEPGTVRTLAYTVMLIGGVSTLLFNGNPLLRFDGYYIFADLIDVPNLATRGNRYIGYLVQRYLFGLDDAASPVATGSERGWLAGYAVAAFLFRMMILFAIVLYVASEFLVVGALLAAWAVLAQLVLPAWRKLAWLLTDPRVTPRRSRAVGVSAGIAAGLLLALFVIPAPLNTRTEGVVWSPDESEVRAGANAVVERLVAVPNTVVEPGDPLVVTTDPELTSRVAILDADLREARARYTSLRATEQVQAGNVMDEIRTIEADLADARQRLDSLTIRSPARGVFLVDRPQDLAGRYLRQGELVGFVADLSRGTVRVAVTQADVGLIRARTEGVELRFAEDIGTPVAARVSREVPAASNRLPSAALGAAGGGLIAVDPRDPDGLETLENVFHVELEIDRPVARIGARTFVRFAHGIEPLGWQWFRRLRQLLLRQFDA